MGFRKVGCMDCRHGVGVSCCIVGSSGYVFAVACVGVWVGAVVLWGPWGIFCLCARRSVCGDVGEAWRCGGEKIGVLEWTMWLEWLGCGYARRRDVRCSGRVCGCVVGWAR